MNVALSVALALPGIVDIDIDVAGVPHSAGNYGIGRRTHISVSDLFRKMVPAIPSHWRSSSQFWRLGLCDCTKLADHRHSEERIRSEKVSQRQTHIIGPPSLMR